MKKKLLMLLIRIARLLKMEERAIPQLNSVPQREVKPGRLYRHYGRIVFTHANPRKVKVEFVNEFEGRITEECYYALLKKGRAVEIRKTSGQACSICALKKLALPCRCDFKKGIFTGYYELIHSPKQYADNPVI